MARRMYSVDQIAGGKSRDITSIDLSVGELGVIYDVFDGATISSQGIVEYSDASWQTINCQYEIPIIPGNGVNIDAAAGNQTVEISLELYRHSIHLYHAEDQTSVYLTIYSTLSTPVMNKQELIDNFLQNNNNTPATGITENVTKIVYSIDQEGQLLCTNLQGESSVNSSDYTVEDAVSTL